MKAKNIFDLFSEQDEEISFIFKSLFENVTFSFKKKNFCLKKQKVNFTFIRQQYMLSNRAI
jgi:hypothetical protein